MRKEGREEVSPELQLVHDSLFFSPWLRRYESERNKEGSSATAAEDQNKMEQLKLELEEEKAQKSFYLAKNKEVNNELQSKNQSLDECKKRIMALENESLAKSAELKKVKNAMEEKENQWSY